MLQRLISTYHRFARWTRPSRWTRPLVALHIVTLEERATPTATPVLTTAIAPPATVQVAPIVTAPASASLAIPMAGQSVVRLDLIAPGEAGQAEHADDWGDLGANPDVFARTPRHDAPPPAAIPAQEEPPVLSTDEMAQLLATRHEDAEIPAL